MAPYSFEQISTKPKDLFTNSLGMKFARVQIPNGESKDKAIYLSIWETRMCDYAAYTKSRPNEIEDVQWQSSENRLSGYQHPHAPVTFVNRRDATAFCWWLTAKEHKEGVLPAHASYRVPTDHEWSCAVGIGQAEDPNASAASKDGKISDIFPWGKAWPPPKGVGNIRVDRDDLNTKFDGVAPVGSFAPGMFGLYDMAGNVGEVVMDSAIVSPAISRGCSWMEIALRSPKSDFFSSTRTIFDPKVDITYRTHKARFNDVGFRCVLEVKGDTADLKVARATSGDASLAVEPSAKFPDSGLKALQVFRGGSLDEARECIRLLDEQLKQYPGNARIEKIKATITGIFREEAALTSALNNHLASENKLKVQMKNLEIASRPSNLTGNVNQDSVRGGQRLVAEAKTAIKSADSTAGASRTKLQNLLNSALDELPAPEGPALEPVWRKVAGRNKIPISK